MTNILFLAFEFPPLNRGGVHRSLAFVKYLPEFGIHPIVVTLDPASYPDVFDQYGLDASLGKELKTTATIIEVKSEKVKPAGRIGQFFSIYFSLHGNEVKNWKQNYFSALPGIMSTYAPKLVFATLPPFSMIPLALKTARQYRLPLVLDFRDAWTQWRTLPFGTRLHYQVNLDLEKKYLDKAAAIITTSLQTQEDFRELHPHIAASKFHYIPNGYDGQLDAWRAPELNKTKIRIGYVGSFYYSVEARKQMLAPWWKKRGHRMLQYMPRKQDWLYRSPYFFFKALKRLQILRPTVFDRIEVEFVGKKPDWLQDMITEMGLQDRVILLGEKSHEEALGFQKGCDLLLITSAKMIGGRDYSIAGKTFEYIQAQKPILSFASQGAQKDILEKTGLALACDPDDPDQSAEKMLGFIAGEIVLKPDFHFIASLSRKTLSGQLAQALTEVLSAQNGS
jgi:glycosyltransferase involved in cell wall biosynthesis